MARKRRTEDEDERHAKKSNSTLIIVGVVCLLSCLCCVPGAGVGLFFAFRGDPVGGGIGAPQAKFTKADLPKIESGMSPAEIDALLGGSRVATQADMRTAFNENRLVPISATDSWMNNGQIVGVTSWRQWQNGEEFIFVGFGKGQKTGKDRALISFWVVRLDKGFQSEPGLLPLFNVGDPDDIAEKRENGDKLRLDPRFKGDSKKTIVGRWLDEVRIGYEFRADGTYERIGRNYNGTYRFTAANVIELNIPAGGEFVGGRALTEKYRVWVSADEMFMESMPDPLKLNYKRSK